MSSQENVTVAGRIPKNLQKQIREWAENQRVKVSFSAAMRYLLETGLAAESAKRKARA